MTYMLTNFLSRYHPRYIRSLVYMMQASEYDICEFLKWFWRTKDFRNVEKRKCLEKTTKAKLLLLFGGIFLIAYIAAALVAVNFILYPYKIFFLISLLYAMPYFLVLLLAVFLFLGQNLLQKPYEFFIIKKAREKLLRHKAIKIAIAGSFGKTSMREILKMILSEGKKARAPGHSYNTPLGISKFIGSLKGDEEVLIFELGEYYTGDIRKLCNLVRPQYGFITGINEAHLDRFRTLSNTVQTIFELSEFVPDNSIYINVENVLARENAKSEFIVYSRKGVNGWKILNPKTDLSGTSFILKKDNIKIKMESSLLGLHQIGPLSAAADMAFLLGLTPEQIQKGVKKTKPFDHRLEPKMDSSGVITLDDSYNGNPDGVGAVIDFLASLKNHRRFYVTPGLVEMSSRTDVVHKEIGDKLAKAQIEKVILIKNSVTPYIERGLKEAGFKGEIRWFNDALSAFNALPSLTVKGDIVLLQNDWPDQYA